MAVQIPIISEFDGTGVKKAVAEFKQLETTGQKAQFILKKAAIPATAALGGLAAGAKVAIGAASDLEESQSKVAVIFGEGADNIEMFATMAAKKLGQSKQSVLNAAGTFGTFGKAAGLSGDDLAKFSNDFTGLASDLASFNNTTPEEAINAIGAALRGESEPLRAYGVLLSDAVLKEEALRLGIYKGEGALTAQQKVLAAQAAIYKQTGDAQGDFARTSDGLANSQRIMEAEMANLKTTMGQSLMPVVEAILPLVKGFAEWAANNPETFKIVAVAIAGIATSILAINAAMALNPISLIAIAIGTVTGLVVIAYQKFETFREVIDNVWNGIKTLFKGIKWWIEEVTIPIVQTLATTFKSIFNGIATAWNNSFGKLKFKIPDWIPGIGGNGFDVPDIPMLASGGIVTGPTLALIGEAGPEAVVPLNKMGNMGGNVTINVNGGDPQAVVDTITRWYRQNGSTVPWMR